MPESSGTIKFHGKLHIYPEHGGSDFVIFNLFSLCSGSKVCLHGRRSPGVVSGRLGGSFNDPEAMKVGVSPASMCSWGSLRTFMYSGRSRHPCLPATLVHPCTAHKQSLCKMTIIIPSYNISFSYAIRSYDPRLIM